jgi:hypothetical protein
MKYHGTLAFHCMLDPERLDASDLVKDATQDAEMLTTANSVTFSVSTVSDYRLDDRGSIPGRGKVFFLSLCVQTKSEDHPVSYPMGTGSPFPGDTARTGRNADHSPPSRFEVKNM